MYSYNKPMYKIIKELQDFSYEQQEIEENRYQQKFWKERNSPEKNITLGCNIPEKILRNATIISHLFILGDEKKIIKILEDNKKKKYTL